MSSPDEPQRCGKCNDVIWFNAHCGAWVCESCGQHKGLARCYCGWAADGGDGREQLVDAGENLRDSEDSVYYREGQAEDEFYTRMTYLDYLDQEQPRPLPR
jgi:hypothetical protein